MSSEVDQVKHTKTPWMATSHSLIFSGDGERMVARVGRVRERNVKLEQADAAFIVRACNSHDALVSALNEIIAAFADPLGHEGSYSRRSKALNAAREALAHATP